MAGKKKKSALLCIDVKVVLPFILAHIVNSQSSSAVAVFGDSACVLNRCNLIMCLTQSFMERCEAEL